MSTYDFNLITAFANSAPSNEIEAFPDYDRGLGIAFDQTDGKPEMKGLNGLFSLLTVSLLALKQRGILTWTTDFEYKQGAFAVESNRLYQAKIDNTSKQPSLSQNDWQVWASVSDIDVDTNGNIIKTAKAGGAFTLKVEDATTTTKGVARFATATETANSSNVSAAVTPSGVRSMIDSTPNIRAFVKSGANGGISIGSGFASVNRISNGLYEFTLSKPAPSANYAVFLTSSWGGGNGAASISLDPNFSQTTTKFRALCAWGGDNTSGSFNPSIINAMVMY